MKKSVCLLTSSFPKDSTDYAGIFIFDLVKHLQSMFNQIKIICPKEKKHSFKQYGNCEIIRFKYFFKLKWQRLTHREGMFINYKKYFLAKLQLPFFLFKFLTSCIIESRNVDYIWSHWIFPSGFIGSLCSKLYKKKHILTIHSTFMFALNKKFIVKKIFNFVINNTDEFIFVSYFLKQEFIKNLSKNQQIGIEKK